MQINAAMHNLLALVEADHASEALTNGGSVTVTAHADCFGIIRGVKVRSSVTVRYTELRALNDDGTLNGFASVTMAR